MNASQRYHTRRAVTCACWKPLRENHPMMIPGGTIADVIAIAGAGLDVITLPR